MSIRLSILLSQGSGEQSELEGQLVADLLGAAGMDLSIVTALPRLTADHTDRLVIEGLSGDFALLGWDAPAELVEHCRRLGVDGRRAPHQLDPEAAAPGGGRQIYAIDLRGRTVAEVRRALDQILKSRQTPTFQLFPTQPSDPSGKPPGARPRGTSPQPSPPGSPSSRPAASREAASRDAVSGDASGPAPAASAAEDAEDALLESLVDDLNDSDI